MKRTSWVFLLRIAIALGLIGWSADSGFRAWTGSYIHVGPGAGIGFALVNVGVVMWAFHIRDRLPSVQKKADGTIELKRAKNPLPPLLAARTAAFSMAASRTGAAAAGFYLGMLIYALPRMSSELAFQHVVMCAPVSVGGFVLALISMWIERRCSPPSPPTEEAAASH